MRSLRPALARIHHGLKQSPEDRGRDLRPIEATRIQQLPAHRRVERRNLELLPEQIAVDIGEAGKVVVQLLLAVRFGSAQDLKQFGHVSAQTSAVNIRSGLDALGECAALVENASMVGEQAENDSHEEPLEVGPPVARLFERIVQRSNDLCCFDVDGILVPEGSRLDSNDESELLDMIRKIFKCEPELTSFVEVVQFEGLEVAHQDVARPLALGERVEVLARLRIGSREVASAALLFDQEDARPEQVDVPRTVVELPNVLLVPGDGTPSYPEDFKEIVVEVVRRATLVGAILPCLDKLGGPNTNFAPRQSHGLLLS